MGEQRSHRDVTVAPPKELVVAKRRVVPGPTDRSAGCPQKQSSPYIHRVQYTVLSVAGLKGTMSEAELHVLKARLRGGILSRARRGELKQMVPVGFVHDALDRVILDPDAQVQAAVRLFFETFQRAGSCLAVVKEFHAKQLLFPRRLRSGVHKGELVWAELLHCRARQIIHNPRYAGAFVFGRTKQRCLPNGKVCSRLVPSE